jgi:hypothetical protein
MNELILELAKQAGLKFPSETALSPQELKFAELLIKDCADCLDDGDMEGLWVRNVLYNRFGVEQ